MRWVDGWLGMGLKGPRDTSRDFHHEGCGALSAEGGGSPSAATSGDLTALRPDISAPDWYLPPWVAALQALDAAGGRRQKRT